MALGIRATPGSHFWGWRHRIAEADVDLNGDADVRQLRLEFEPQTAVLCGLSDRVHLDRVCMEGEPVWFDIDAAHVAEDGGNFIGIVSAETE